MADAVASREAPTIAELERRLNDLNRAIAQNIHQARLSTDPDQVAELDKAHALLHHDKLEVEQQLLRAHRASKDWG